MPSGSITRRLKSRLLEAIHKRFGLPESLPAAIAAEIKSADRIAAFYEATVLAGFEEAEALAFFGEPDGIGPALATEMQSTLSANGKRGPPALSKTLRKPVLDTLRK